MPNKLLDLNETEKRCLLLVARNSSSKEIAAELGLSPTTIDTYIHRATAKLKASNRREAARLYLASTQENQSKLSISKSEQVAEREISSEEELSPPEPKQETNPAPSGIQVAIRWLIERFGGPQHDLSRLETIQAILWTALTAAGILAAIITIGAWLNYKAS